MAARKHGRPQKDAALLLFGTGMLNGVSPCDLRRYYLEAYGVEEQKRLIAAGHTPEEATRLAKEAEDSERNFRRDIAKLQEGLALGKAEAGEALILMRIESYEVQRLKTLRLQAECWKQYRLTENEVSKTFKTKTVVRDRPGEAGPDAEAENGDEDAPGAGVGDELNRVTLQSGTRSLPRSALALWIDRLLDLSKEEDRINSEIFRLNASLDKPMDLPLDLSVVGNRKAVARAVAMEQVRYLGRSLTKATGGRLDPTVTRLLSAALGEPWEDPGFPGDDDLVTVKIIDVASRDVSA